MKLELKGSETYAARVVSIQSIVELEGMNTVAGTILFGQHVIVSKNTPIGTVGIYFPVETSICQTFLSKNNLYASVERNADPTARPGLFSGDGRVRCKTFQKKFRSEGFFIPIESMVKAFSSLEGLVEGAVFDTVDGEVFCIKSTRTMVNSGSPSGSKKKTDKRIAKFDRLIDDQFRLHIDTSNLAYNLHQLKPTDTIGLSVKIHGTSWVVGNVLTKKPLKLKDRIARFFGIAVEETTYDVICASRNVVKNRHINTEATGGFYQYDLWTDIKNSLCSKIPKGYTLYGEAVGYLPTGQFIQKGYHYGCMSNTYKTVVYRITFTNTDGEVFELSEPQIEEFCAARGLQSKKMLFYGKAGDCFPDIPVDSNWAEAFHERLRHSFEMEQMCSMNKYQVPYEGVVLRIEKSSKFDVFKCKSFLFNKKESESIDRGEIDIETEESVAEEK